MPNIETPSFAADRYRIEVTEMQEDGHRVALLDASTGKTLKALMGVPEPRLQAAVHMVIAQQDAEGPAQDPVAIAARAAFMLIALDAALHSDGTNVRDQASLLAHLSCGVASMASISDQVATTADATGKKLGSHSWAVTAHCGRLANRRLLPVAAYLETAAEQALHGQAEIPSGRS